MTMGWRRRVEDELAALTEELEALDRQIEAAAQDVADAARAKAFPEAWLNTTGENLVASISKAWATARQPLADLVSAVGKRVDRAMAPLEDKPKPTRSERLGLAWRNLVAMRRAGNTRSGAMSLDQALLLSNNLHTVLVPRRKRVLELRNKVESDLLDMTGHRAALADAIGQSSDPERREESTASARVEHCLTAIQNLTTHLNRQVIEMNALLNKLSIDTQRAVVLASVVAEDRPESARSEGLTKAELPQLAQLISLNETGMLSSVGLQQRRGRIDARFDDLFGEGAHARALRGPVEGMQETVSP
jgi:hypothetical protein